MLIGDDRPPASQRDRAFLRDGAQAFLAGGFERSCCMITAPERNLVMNRNFLG